MRRFGVTNEHTLRLLLPVIGTLPLGRCNRRRHHQASADKSQNHRGENGERDADPQQAEIDRKIEGAKPKTRRVTS